MNSKAGEFCGLPVIYFANGVNPWREPLPMERGEQLRAIRTILEETRRQECVEWNAAETGISELPSTENRERAIILRVRVTEIIRVALSIGFTRDELA